MHKPAYPLSEGRAEGESYLLSNMLFPTSKWLNGLFKKKNNHVQPQPHLTFIQGKYVYQMPTMFETLGPGYKNEQASHCHQDVPSVLLSPLAIPFTLVPLVVQVFTHFFPRSLYNLPETLSLHVFIRILPLFFKVISKSNSSAKPAPGNGHAPFVPQIFTLFINPLPSPSYIYNITYKFFLKLGLFVTLIKHES